MNTEILLDMLFEFLSKRRVTATYLAEKYGVSERTVYRYVEALSKTLPIFVKRGRNGGICLSDSYRLPVGFMSSEEYTAVVDALQLAYKNDPNPRFLHARRKLSAQAKTETQTLSLGGDAHGFFVEENLPSLTQKTQAILDCMREEVLAEVEYHPANGEKITSKIEPHSLILQDRVWYLYAFCHHHRDFHLFTVGRINGIVKTDETFRKRHFDWQDIPLQPQAKKHLTARLEIAENALESIRDKVGLEKVKCIQGKWIAELSLPEDKAEETVLSLGIGVKVLSPASLREKVANLAKTILKNNL
ncbi:MAG: WYL domain-containing protein [Clostridia bacterium]|nr:WYL domain-containing protein [Clostridia bacterium]